MILKSYLWHNVKSNFFKYLPTLNNQFWLDFKSMALPLPGEQTHLVHPKYRADIDGLRAIAVLSVVGFHAFPNLMTGGFVGVDVFFVISGFLISTIIFGSLERNNFSYVEFYFRRINRIFPALLLVMIASFALGWFMLLPNEYKQLSKHIAGGAGFISNFLLWNESGYFVGAANSKPLLHLWSLGVEEQFYIIWPILLWFAWKIRINLFAIAIFVGLISFALNVDIVRSDAVAAFYSPQTRFWELMAGSVLAYMTLHKQNMFLKVEQRFDVWFSRLNLQAPTANGSRLRDVQALLGAILIAIGIFVITNESLFPGWWALLPTLGSVLIILAGSQAWLNRAVLSNRVLVWLGLISYPLYLWHWPLLSLARIVEMEAPSMLLRIAIVIISIALAWLTYRLIERPLRFGNRSEAKAIILLLLMVAVGCVGYYSYERDGLGFRFPILAQEITTFEYDYKNGYREGTCFLRAEQNYSDFNSCESPSKEYKRPSILLWGDSHAAHLYPGYKALFGETSEIIQRTASSCPPILNFEFGRRPHCKEINDHIFELIKNEKPNKIVLAANWQTYDWKQVEGTITQLRNIGITDIDLIGPVPQWAGGLPRRLYLKLKSDKLQRVPERMMYGLNPNFIRLNIIMSGFSKQLQVNYISPANILCNKDGCLTRIGGSFTAWDNAHLTEMGSRFLVSQFPK